MPPQKADKTDIYGFLAAASDRFQFETDRKDCDKLLIITSDMRDNCHRKSNTDLYGAKVKIAGFQSGTDPNETRKIKDEWINILVNNSKAESVTFLPADINLVNF